VVDQNRQLGGKQAPRSFHGSTVEKSTAYSTPKLQDRRFAERDLLLLELL